MPRGGLRMHSPKLSYECCLDWTEVLDFRISRGSLGENLSLLLACSAQRCGLWVVTLNLEMVARASRDPDYQLLLRSADLIVADGVPLVWLSRLLPANARIRGRTNGTDLAELLLRSAASRPIGLVGGLDPARVVEALALPEGRVGLVESGGIDASAECVARLARLIMRSGCGIVLVGLGVPKQDQVCRALRDAVPGVVYVGLGGALDLLADLKRRAPLWMQRAGLEWLYRLLTEPRRLWRRYFLLYPRVLPAVCTWGWRKLWAAERKIGGR
jgi:N-acetylglucosaminyldiphosphoundecaprenol N-acetyl-beta-D-mannosaminyltransferase